jgi:membrane peptidoglycan carboxypeptidase
MRVEPVSILKIEDRSGRVIYEYKPVQGKRVISQGEAYLMNDILSDNSARQAAFGANSLLNTGKPIAVKTGTTNDQKDNWTIGWSQSTMVGVWVGNNDNSSMKQVASGVTGASPIWRRIMFDAIAQGRAAEEWNRPGDVEEVEVNAISGYPAHSGLPVKKERVIRGTLPSLPDPIHSKLKVCRGQNKLASEIRVARGDYEEKEYVALREKDPISQDGKNRWQDAVNAWVADKDDKYKPPTEYCDDGDAQNANVFIQLKQPENQKTYDSDNIDVEVDAVSIEGIEKVEIWVNGSRRETLTSRPYRTTLNLPKGRYEIQAKAKDNKGREAQSSVARIGTKGENWQTPTPTPLPQPTATPVVILPTAPPATGGGQLNLSL